MYLSDMYDTEFNANLLKITDSKECRIEGNTLQVLTTNGDKRYWSSAGKLKSKKEASRQLIEYCFGEAGSLWENAGMTKTELRKLFKTHVLHEWE